MDDAHLLQYCWCMKVSLEQIAYIRPIQLAARRPHAAQTRPTCGTGDVLAIIVKHHAGASRMQPRYFTEYQKPM